MTALGRRELGGPADIERELSESRAREAALAAVLGIMRRGPSELTTVLESVAMNAVRLCAADNGSIARLGSDGWRIVANAGDIDQESMERNWGNQPIEADRRSLTGRVLMDRRTTTIVDAQTVTLRYDLLRRNDVWTFRGVTVSPTAASGEAKP